MRVIVIDEGWASFQQLAIRLQRDGVDVTFINMHPSQWSQRATRRIFRHSCDGSSGGLAAALVDAGMSDADDIICSEETLRGVLHVGEELGLPEPMLQELKRRLSWADKWLCSQRLSSAGIPVPKTCGEDETPEDAVRLLGLPVVIKRTVGAGGSGVAVAKSVEMASQASTAAREARQHFYYEEFMSGRSENYVVARSQAAGLLAEGAYEDSSYSERRFGPATSMRTIAPDDLFRLGRSVVNLADARGLANVEVMRGRDGDLRVIDVNLRPWGTCMTLRRAGVKFERHYVAALGGLPRSSGRVGVVQPGVRAEIFPTVAFARAEVAPFAAVRCVLRHLWPTVRDYGPVYAAAVAMQVGRAAWRSWRS